MLEQLSFHPGPGRAKNQKSESGANYTWFERKKCPEYENYVIEILNLKKKSNYVNVWFVLLTSTVQKTCVGSLIL